MEQFNQCYAFGIGYRDGRDKGYSEDIETIVEEDWYYYNIGYEAGVADFCRFELDNTEKIVDNSILQYIIDTYSTTEQDNEYTKNFTIM